MSLLQATQYQINLAINVITQDDTGLHFAVLPLISLGWLIIAIWQFRLLVNRFRFALATIKDDFIGRLSIVGKLLGIGFRSVLWGVM